MHKVKVIKDFGEIIDKASNKPKYGFRPKVGKQLRLNDTDFAITKADGLVEELKPAELKKK